MTSHLLVWVLCWVLSPLLWLLFLLNLIRFVIIFVPQRIRFTAEIVNDLDGLTTLRFSYRVGRESAISEAVFDHQHDHLSQERRIGLRSYVRNYDRRYGALIATRVVTRNADTYLLMTVLVTNSTAEPTGEFRHYLLVVPPEMRSAREAVAWTFGMEEHEYQPLLQS